MLTLRGTTDLTLARREMRATARLALPIALVQTGMMLMGVVDTMMVGHLSAQALASVALGNLYFWNVAAAGIGMLFALDPLIAQSVGAGDLGSVARNLQRGLLVAAGLTLLLGTLLLPSAAVLRFLGQPEAVVGDAALYTRLNLFGLFPFLAFGVLRQTLQALQRTRAIVLTIVIANIANVALDWALIFGNFGMPAMGVAGSAWATTASRVFMFVLLFALAWPELRPMVRPWRAESWDRGALGRLLVLGLPLAGHQLLEVGAFGTIGLLMGRLGTPEVASHQIAINLAALTFMVPLGVAMAASVRVGHAIGAAEMPRARAAAIASLVCGAAFMACTATLFLAFPHALARLFTRDAGVLALTATLIPIAGVFQVFDGVQAVAAGILRGVGDVRAALMVNLVGFWLCGIPVSTWLAFGLGLGAKGLWWGFVAGLGAVALFLLMRVRVRLATVISRTRVD